jgi:hypothetical protein
MKEMCSIYGAAIITAVMAIPASAQEVGTYTGSSADGQSLTFAVERTRITVIRS